MTRRRVNIKLVDVTNADNRLVSEIWRRLDNGHKNRDMHSGSIIETNLPLLSIRKQKPVRFVVTMPWSIDRDVFSSEQ